MVFVGPFFFLICFTMLFVACGILFEWGFIVIIIIIFVLPMPFFTWWFIYASWKEAGVNLLHLNLNCVIFPSMCAPERCGKAYRIYCTYAACYIIIIICDPFYRAESTNTMAEAVSKPEYIRVITPDRSRGIFLPYFMPLPLIIIIRE